MALTPVETAWDLFTTGSIEQAWAVLSDSDRVNRSVGFGFRFEHGLDERGRPLRRGSVRRAGVSLLWDEVPFTYERPRWFRTERRFHGGPAERLTATCHFAEVEGGTAVRFVIRVYPRNLLAKGALALDARFSVRPSMTPVLEEAMRRAAVGEVLPDPPPVLPTESLSKLDTRLMGVQNPLREWLVQAIRDAPLREQARLRPLAAARALGVPREAAIQAFLAATRAGALELRWELLCPSCRFPQSLQGALGVGGGAVHCASCNIDYDEGLADALEVVFRPAPDIRRVDPPLDCLLSPAHTPHVLAQRAIPPGEEVEFELDLPAGGYRLLTEPAGRPASVRVGQGPSRASLRVGHDRVTPEAVAVGAGPVRLWVENRSANLVWVRLEERWRPPDTLTAGELLGLPEALALLPEEAILPGVGLETALRTVVAAELVSGRAEHLDLIAARMREHGAALVHLANRPAPDATWSGEPRIALDATVIGLFTTPEAGLALARALDGERLIALGVAVGPTVVLEQGEARWPMGVTVEQALSALRAAGAGRAGLWSESLESAGLAEVLAAAGDRATPLGAGEVSLLRFAASAGRAASAVFAQGSGRLAPVLDGRFRVERPLAKGGMGQVFLAVDLQQGEEEVVVKQLHPRLAGDAWQVQQFFTEARLAARLSHPHVVRVLDWGTDPDGNTWIAMERLEGEELKALLADGPLGVERAREVAVDALAGLGAAHAAGIVHRDIKPANLFVCRDGSVKVIDFGIAAHADATDPFTQRGVVIGTPQYISPEQLALQPVDGRADLYALGVVLYECLVGKLPFEGGDPTTTAQLRLTQPPPPLPERFPSALASVVAKALERDPADRWPDAEAMRGALRP